ncbi:MAG: hypothetical protein QXU99_01460 [Candidatus Bathyarchaeia archaeon]
MPEQQKTTELSTVKQQISKIKAQVEKANSDARAYAEKRDAVNEQHRKLRQEIRTLTEERNRLNTEVKALKQQRDEIRTKIAIKIVQIKELRQKLSEIKKKTPKQSQQQLQKDLSAIEWKIQTTPLDQQEEKRLIENIKQIEAQLNIYKKIGQQQQKIAEMQNELHALKTEADMRHQQLSVNAQKSQEIHVKIAAKLDEAKKLKSEADELHSAYLQAKEKIKPLNDEIKRLISQKTNLQKIIHEEKEQKRKTEENALKEKLSSQAKQKLEHGEKLSWQEFQLLIGDDEQTQD